MALGYIEYVQKMHEIIKVSKADPEMAHGMADDLLCQIILDLADDSCALRFSEAQEIIDLYKKVEKYYA